MSIDKLTMRVKKAAGNRTDEERLQLLKKAKILTQDSLYNSRFFTKDTVNKSKQARTVIK